MLDHEARTPLLVGFILALAAHVGGAVGIVALRRADFAGPTRPDVAVTELTASEPRIAGKPATFRVRLSNRGDRAAESVTVRAAVDGAEFASATLSTALKPGEAVEQTFQHTVEKPGPHRVGVRAELDGPGDAGGDSSRKSESEGNGGGEANATGSGEIIKRNNRRERTFIWVAPEGERAAGPDLLPFELTVGRPRVAGKPVEVGVRVGNTGGAVERPVTVSLRVDGEEVGRHTFRGAMPAGAAHRYSREITVEEAGEHTIAAVVDPGQQISETDETNNAIRREVEWRQAREKKEPVIGGEHTSPTAVSWISHEDFEKLRARKSKVDQAAVQREVEPVPEARQMPLNPTPPAPQSRASRRSASAMESAEPAAPRQTAEADPQPEEPSRPEQPEDSEKEEPKEAPVIAKTPDEEAAAPERGEARAPSELRPVGMERDRPRPVVDRSPNPDGESEPPVDAPEAPELELARPPVEPGMTEPGGETELPTPLRPERMSATAASRAPDLEPEPTADPDDSSKIVDAAPMETPQLAASPLPAKPTSPGTSPNEQQRDETPEDREEQQPKKPVRPEKPETDGARPDPEQQTETEQSPQQTKQQPQRRPAPNRKANPTAAPKDERESPPVRRVEDAKIHPGEVLARPGIRINTVQPRFSPIALRSATPVNPDVRLVFNKKGEVLEVRLVKSTGYDNVDGPLLTSLYKWTAEGPRLKEIEDKLIVEVHILLVPEE